MEDSTKRDTAPCGEAPPGRAAAARADLLRRLGPLAALAVLSLLLAFGGDDVREWARYERGALEAGELWRLATAHLVHLGWAHLWLNLLGLGLLGTLLHDAMTARDWTASTVAGALGIGAGLYLLDEWVVWYVGLSGVLHAQLAWGAVRLLEGRRPLGLMLAAGLAGKLVWEQWGGTEPLSGGLVGPVIVDAHLYGALAGALAGGLSAALRSPQGSAAE